MRKKPARRSDHSNAFGIAIFVGSLIGLLVIAAFVIKIILLFHQSTFDGKHQYVVAVKDPHETQFFVFDPDNSSIQTLTVEGRIPLDLKNVQYVPLDATAVATDPLSLSDLTKSLVFNRKQLHASMTIIDAINLMIYSHTVSNDQISSQAISLADFTGAQSQAPKTFLDNTIYQEGKSIAVINATNVSGLGTKVGNIITAIGGNVVSVTSADNPSHTSSVAYTGTLSYTASRLSHVLHLPLVHLSGVQISDITVTIGTDNASLFQ